MARYNGIPACGTKYADGKVTTGTALRRSQQDVIFAEWFAVRWKYITVTALLRRTVDLEDVVDRLNLPMSALIKWICKEMK